MKKQLKLTEGDKANTMVKIFRSSYRFSGNVYIVHSEKGTILIDPGYYDSGIKKYLMGIGNLDAILLTRGHWDHIYSLDSLKADFPETPVYIFEDDIDFLTNSYLQSSLTNFPYFTKLPEPQTMKLYVFSLVFALMGNLQGKVFSYCPTTLSKSLAEVRFASLVAWA